MPIRHDLFTYVTNQMRGGLTQDELSEALNECVQRSRDTGKTSTLTLNIKIKPNGSTGQYHLTDTIKIALPSLDKGDSIMFGTPEGNLQREDPAQQSLDLKSVSDDRPITLKKAESE